MSEQPYMQLWIADYLGDTQHLSIEQSGMYLHLLFAMWRAGGSLPNDEVKLSRIVRVSVARWRKVGPEVLAFFEAKNGLLTQKRLIKELKRAQDRSEAASASALSRWLKNKEAPPANAMPSHSERNANQNQNQLVPIGTNNNSRAKRGNTIPPNWKPSADDLLWASGQNYPLSFVESQTEAMRLWAEANSNRAVARKADWSKTWKGWLKREWPKWQRASGQAPPSLSRTQAAINKLREKHGTGFSGSEICDGGGELSPVLISTTSAEPGGLRGSTDSPLRRAPEITLAPDGEPG